MEEAFRRLISLCREIWGEDEPFNIELRYFEGSPCWYAEVIWELHHPEWLRIYAQSDIGDTASWTQAVAHLEAQLNHIRKIGYKNIKTKYDSNTSWCWLDEVIDENN